MNTKDFARKILSLRLWGNLLAMLLVVVLLCFGVKFGIDIYTHHGEEIAIPDVRRKLFTDAEFLLDQKGLRIEVSDTGYVKTLPPDCILEQQPGPGRKVKSGRVIYVVINSSHSPLLTLPDIIDNCSYREARAKLTAMGFRVGPPEYIPGEKDWVYGVKSRGRILSNGQKVSVDDMVIIQVGDGLRSEDDPFIYADPDDYGMENGDSLTQHGNAEGKEKETGSGTGDVDEFEVVTSPNQ